MRRGSRLHVRPHFGSLSSLARPAGPQPVRVYTLPSEPPPLYIAAAGPQAARDAAERGDGLITVSPEKKVVEAFNSAGGSSKPRFGQVTVCWAPDESSAKRTAQEWWASAAVPGELSQELPLPRHLEQATQILREGE